MKTFLYVNQTGFPVTVRSNGKTFEVANRQAVEVVAGAAVKYPTTKGFRKL